jgi:hypothetical protein
VTTTTTLPPVDGPRDLAILCSSAGAILGTVGDDQLNGTQGRDVICSFGGDDVIYGLGGDDIVLAGSGNDFVDGGDGIDRIDGGPGDDSLAGGMGPDSVTGAEGTDYLSGGEGNDQLLGQADNDLLVGGLGNDAADGGLGIDKCVESESVIACEPATEFEGLLAQRAFSAEDPADSRIVVAALSSADFPSERLVVSEDLAWSLPGEIAATPAVSVSFVTGSQPLSATITLPLNPDITSTEPLTVALVDPDSQLLVPVETVIERLPGALRFSVAHFSSYLVVRGSASQGQWDATTLALLYGDFPAKCSPAGAGGTNDQTAFVIAFDTSGSMVEAETPINGATSLPVRAQWLSKLRLRNDNPFSVLSFAGDSVWISAADLNGGGLPIFTSLADMQQSKSETFLSRVPLGSFGDSDSSSAIQSAVQRIVADTATQRALIMVTDDEGAARITNSDADFLQTNGIYLFLVRIGSSGSLPPIPITGRPFVKQYRAKSIAIPDATLSKLRSDLTDLEKSLSNSIDTDGDGLTDCEESNGFFVAGRVRTQSSGIPSSNLFGAGGRILFTRPDVADSDLDQRNDGAEVTRHELLPNTTLGQAFKVFYDKGFRYYFRPITGLPTEKDTDGDGTDDFGSGPLPTVTRIAGHLATERCGSQWTDPLNWDTNSTGLGDTLQNVVFRTQQIPIKVRNLDTVKANLFIKDQTAKWACRPVPSILSIFMQCALGNNRDWDRTAGPAESKVSLKFDFRAGILEFSVNETCWRSSGSGPFGQPLADECVSPLAQTWLDTKGFTLANPGTDNFIKFYDSVDTFSLCYQAKLAGVPLGVGPSINGELELQFQPSGVNIAVSRNQYPRLEVYLEGRDRELVRLDQSASGLYGLWDSVSWQSYRSIAKKSPC